MSSELEEVRMATTIKAGTVTSEDLVRAANAPRPAMFPAGGAYYYAERRSGLSASVAWVDPTAGQRVKGTVRDATPDKGNVRGYREVEREAMLWQAGDWHGPLPRVTPEGDSYNWGGPTVGARHLAEALLAHAVGSEAIGLAARLVSEVLAEIKADRWSLSREQLRAWAEGAS